MKVIGLGAQDSLPEAKAFVRERGTRSFPMVWDPSGESWTELGVPAQPAAVLFDRRGRERGRWFGEFDGAAILRRLPPA